MDVAYGFNVCDVRMTRLGDWGLRLCTPKRLSVSAVEIGFTLTPLIPGGLKRCTSSAAAC